MAETLPQVLDTITAKCRALADVTDSLRRENEELRDKINELKSQVSQLEEENAGLRVDCEFLTMSHKLADNPDRIIEARRHIAKLIRNIDRCMEMLKE